MVSDDFWKPLSWEGSIVRFAKTPSGGAAVEAWRNGAWRAVDVPASKLFGLPLASAAELRKAGVSEAPSATAAE